MRKVVKQMRPGSGWIELVCPHDYSKNVSPVSFNAPISLFI